MKIFINPVGCRSAGIGRGKLPDGTTVRGIDIVFDISLMLYQMLEIRTDNTIFLARHNDECISDEPNVACEEIERANLANKLRANCAISLSMRENKRNHMDRGWAMTYARIKTTKSKYLANSIRTSLKKRVPLPNRYFKGNISFFNCACKCDAVHIDVATISNPQDLEWIVNPENQYLVALAIYEGMKHMYGMRFKVKSELAG